MQNAQAVSWLGCSRKTKYTPRDWQLLHPPGISEAGRDLKITREEIPW